MTAFLPEHPDVKARQPFPLLSDEELDTLPPVEWLVENMLQRAEVNILYGPRGAGKTFLAADLGFSVASGGDWLGRETAQGPVLYVALENVHALRDRRRAWRLANQGADTSALSVLRVTDETGPVTFNHVGRLVATVEAMDPRPSLVVVDTFSRFTPGQDENHQKDMSLVVEALDRLKRAEVTVLLVHHAGKDSTRGARGSSVLEAAATGVLRVAKDGKDLVLSCTKQNNAEEFEDIHLEFRAAGPSAVVVPVTAFDQELRRREEAENHMVAYVRDNPRASREDVVKAAGVKATHARDWLNELVSQLVMTEEKVGNARRYYLPNREVRP